MLPDLKTSLVISLAVVGLSACSSVPKSSTLMTGIDTTQLSKPAPNTLRAATDPVCVSFYDNVETYVAAANQPNKGRNFLTSLGVGVLASVATAGIVPSGLGSVGQAAASTAVSTTVRQGSGMVMQGIKENSKTGEKIADAAAEIGCPISLAP